MRRALLDSNVFLHALGTDEDLRAACLVVIEALAAGRLVGEASSLLLNEVVHVRHRRGGDRRAAVMSGRAAARLLVVRAVDDVDSELALDLFQNHPGLQMSDAVHVAVARRHGLDTVVSTNRGFDAVAGLHRVDPLDRSAVRELIED